MRSDNTWASWAEERLRRNWRSAVQSALEKAASGRWHPNGFIVFRLGEVYGGNFIGSHRVHIWPGGIARRTLPGHPTIHSHDWELQSLVLSGQYADAIFGTSTEAPAFLAHAVEYGGAEGDSIIPTGGNIQLAREDLRFVQVGTCHHMDVGVPHETLVPDGETVVTYVMMGPKHAEGMMLAGEAPYTVSGLQRRALDNVEQAYVKTVLHRLLTATVTAPVQGVEQS